MKKPNNPLSGIDYKKTIFSPRWFMENMLYIVDKEGNLVKFKLNEEQEKMMFHIEFCLENDLPIRMIVLKARQIGSTTFFTGLGFWIAAMNMNTTYGIVAHRLDSAQSIFQKCKIFYNNLENELRPSTIQMSGEGITFDKKDGKGINSKIKFATVNEGVFRGQTLTYLHLTECAFWEGNIQAIENSLAPTVPLLPRTFIVRESTANGYNTFKDDWDRANRSAKDGGSEFTPFFFGWQDHSEYVKEVPKGYIFTDEEKELKKRFDLSDEQIYWRRYQIDNNYGGNTLWFKQENPMTPQEAFIASGTGVFDAETIEKGYEGCIDPIAKEEITSYPTFEKLLIWEQPQTEHKLIYQQKSQWSFEKQEYELIDTDLVIEEHDYLTPYTVGVDTSGMGADRNQIVVTNNLTKKTAARYGKKDLSEKALALISVEIAKKYNNALIIPEVNYSHEVCNYIIGLGYKNLYITENVTRQDQKIVGGIEYGFKTTRSTKPALISTLRTHLQNDPTIVQDKEFWYEAEYYILEKNEKSGLYSMNAASGHHDDIIIAKALSVYGSESFQSKQSKVIVKTKNKEHFLTNMMKKGRNKKKTPIRKGMYRNNA